MLDRGWVPGDNAQAEDRIVEAGKTDPLLYTDLLIDHPLEEHLLYVLLLKQEQIVRIDQVSNQCNDPNRSIKSTEHAMALISGNAEFEHDIDLSPLEG
jgi:SNF2 family DNA or RNA helicase